MKPEVIKQTNRPEKLLPPDIFDGRLFNERLVRKLNAPIFGLYKDQILEEIASRVNALDPETRSIFIGEILGILSDPDPDPSYRQQRGTGLHVLSVINLTDVNRERLTEDYVRSVYNLRDILNKEYYQYREIRPLLEAGKIVAPFLKYSQGATQAWHKVAEFFIGPDNKEIIDGIKHIVQLRASDLDKSVALLKEQRRGNTDIAFQLGITPKELDRSLTRIKKKFERERKPGKRSTSS